MIEQDSPPSLPKAILKDLLSVGKLPLLLLCLVFVTAIGVVFTTYDTRARITYRDQLLDKRAQLDNEWRNLILEENALSEHTRIQRLATRELDMRRPDSDKEITVELK